MLRTFYEALNAYTLEDVAQHSVLAHLFAPAQRAKLSRSSLPESFPIKIRAAPLTTPVC